jgi:hypothetical protein
MKARNFDNERLQATIEFHTDEGKWPSWPVLPLKNVINNKLGILYSGHGLTVFECNMFQIKDLSAVPFQKFTTIDELIAEGWRVD